MAVHCYVDLGLVVEKGITIGGKTMQEHLEAINHALAINFIEELVFENGAVYKGKKV